MVLVLGLPPVSHDADTCTRIQKPDSFIRRGHMAVWGVGLECKPQMTNHFFRSAEGQQEAPRRGNSAPLQLGDSVFCCSRSPGCFCQTLGETPPSGYGVLQIPTFLLSSHSLSLQPGLASVPPRLTSGAETGRLDSGQVSAWPGAGERRVTWGSAGILWWVGTTVFPPVVWSHPGRKMGEGLGDLDHGEGSDLRASCRRAQSHFLRCEDPVTQAARVFEPGV